jgi:hypothetical protein
MKALELTLALKDGWRNIAIALIEGVLTRSLV